MRPTSQDQKLFTAVRSQNVVETKALLEAKDTKINVNCTDEIEGNTPLHIAVSNNDPAMVSLLLTHGAKTFITNREFKNPIQKATTIPTVLIADAKADTVIMQLLRHRTTLKLEDLQDMLAFCGMHYHGDDEKKVNDDRALLDFAVSNLVGADIDKLRRDGDIWKYYGHLTSIKGTKSRVGGEISMESWHTDKFLALRIRSLFDIIVRLEKGLFPLRKLPILKENSSPVHNSRVILNILYQELLTELETLHLDHCAFAILQLSDALKPIAYLQLAKNIAARLQSLAEGHELSFSGGWIGHAVYINFIRQGTHVIIRVDNLGQGCHDLYPSGHAQSGQRCHIEEKSIRGTKIYPYVIGAVPLTTFDPQQMTLPYLQAIVRVHRQTQSIALPTIYNFENLIPPNTIRSLTPQLCRYPADRAQTVGNCTVKNHQIGLHIRLGRGEGYDSINHNYASLSFRFRQKNQTIENSYIKNRKRFYHWIRHEEHAIADPKLPETRSIYTQHWVLYAQPRQLPRCIDETLRNFYKDQKEIIRLFDEKGIPIENCANLNLVKNKIPQGIESKHEETKAENKISEETIALENIFRDYQGPSQRILIAGDAGVGKSTLCQLIAYQWSQRRLWQEKFDVIIWIRLRNLTPARYPAGPRYTVADILRNEFFQSFTGWQVSDEVLERNLREKKVLWILDGYDELPQPLPDSLKWAFDQLLTMNSVIITSRPQYSQAIRHDVKLKLVGFTDNNIRAYIQQFFRQTAPVKELSAESKEVKETSVVGGLKADQLLTFLKINPNLWALGRIPILLEILCKVLSKLSLTTEGIAVSSMTILYQKVMAWLMHRHLEKIGRVSSHLDEKNVLNEREMILLEELAFAAQKNNAVIINMEIIKTTFSELKEEKETNALEKLIQIGILKPVEATTIQSAVMLERDYYFIHLSFQEFLAARRQVRKLLNTESEDYQIVLQWIAEHKYESQKSLVFSFMAGLLSDSKDQFAEQRIQDFWQTLQEPPRDLVGFRHLQLIIGCLEQAQCDVRIPKRKEILEEIVQTTIAFNSSAMSNDLIPNKILFENWLPLLSQNPLVVKISKLIDIFLAPLRDTKTNVHIRARAVEILGRLNVAAAMPNVTDLLREVGCHKEPFLYRLAAEVYGRLFAV